MRSSTHTKRRIHLALWVLGLPQAAIGVWALLWPRSFYDDFPLLGRAWVAGLGPFNEHLVRDVGSLFIALGVMMLIAARTMTRRAVIGACVVWLLYAVPHVIFHATHTEPFDLLENVAQLALLATQALLPLFVISWARRL